MLVSADCVRSRDSSINLSLSVKIPLSLIEAGNSPSLRPITMASFILSVRSIEAEPIITSSTDVGIVPILLSENISESAPKNSSKVNSLSAFFGGCPNTTYGESIGCVAITGNASSITILYASIMCLIISFFTPFVAFLQTIPTCVMGGVCIALYGFIATSGLKIMQSVDLTDNRNMFVSSIILITGVGGLVLSFGAVEIRTVACALILGIVSNKILSKAE